MTMHTTTIPATLQTTEAISLIFSHNMSANIRIV
jgi:hypothetical protein